MTVQEKEPLSPPDGFKMISEWSLGKLSKADNRCKTLVLQRFFFLYNPITSWDKSTFDNHLSVTSCST